MVIDDTFRSRIKELDDKIFNLKDIQSRSTPIIDGIVDLDQYAAQDLKIMWILKEVNSEDDTDEWDLRTAIADLKKPYGILKGWAGTFNPIVYATCGIIADELWEDVPNTNANPEIIDVLKKIAYVNVKKIPGGANADHSKVQASYNLQKEILMSQIELFEPNIIICGGTFSFIKNELNLENFKQIDHLPRAIYCSPKRLIIDTYHPNNRTITQEKYCNNIHDGVKRWKEKYRKL